MAEEKLSPDRAVRLLRAKAAELERRLLVVAENPVTSTDFALGYLGADIALIAGLLADHIDRTEHWQTPNITPQIVHDAWGKVIDPERIKREEKQEREDSDG